MTLLLGSIQAMLTVFGAGKSIYDFVTGNTVGALRRHMDRLHASVERLDEHIYYRDEQEVFDISAKQQRIVHDLSLILEGARPVQQVCDDDVLVTNPILTPERLRSLLGENPERILFDVKPLARELKSDKYSRDDTLLPMVFERDGELLIGFMKTGYAEEFLGVKYRPLARGTLALGDGEISEEGNGGSAEKRRRVRGVLPAHLRPDLTAIFGGDPDYRIVRDGIAIEKFCPQCKGRGYVKDVFGGNQQALCFSCGHEGWISAKPNCSHCGGSGWTPITIQKPPGANPCLCLMGVI